MLEYGQIQELNNCLSHMKNKGLSVEGIKGTVKLKIKLKQQIQETQALIEAVMDKFGIEKSPAGIYNWVKNENAKEITAALDAISKEKIDLGDIKCITMDELINSTPDVAVEIIAVLSERIVKD